MMKNPLNQMIGSQMPNRPFHANAPVLKKNRSWSGMIAIAIPVYYLARPSPPTPPYNWFPYAALGVIVVSVIYAVWLTRRDPNLGDRVGSIVADE